MQHLDHLLFYDVYTTTIEWLQDPFEKFRQSQQYAILLEDVKRQDKLHHVMIEGMLIN